MASANLASSENGMALVERRQSRPHREKVSFPLVPEVDAAAAAAIDNDFQRHETDFCSA